MMKRIFLDTNVLIDLICCRKPFVQEAERIFVMGDMKKISIGISALSFINTVYIAGKYHFNVLEVIESLKKIASFVSITDLNEAIIKHVDIGAVVFRLPPLLFILFPIRRLRLRLGRLSCH